MRPILTAFVCMAVLHGIAGNAGAIGLLVPAVQKVPPCSFRPEGCNATGQATLDIGDEILTISNIGSSGQDGVEIDLRLPDFRTLGTFMDWQWWDPTDSLPIGAMFRSEISGTIGGVQDLTVGAWQMMKTDSGTYDSFFVDLGFPAQRMRIVLNEVLAQYEVPDGAAVVMRIDPGVLDPEVPFQQAWIVGEGTEGASSGDVPLPPGMEVFCGGLFECEYHGWPALSELGLRVGGDVVQTIATDPNQTTGILAVLGDGSVRSSVEEITTLRLTFANIPEFQISGLQLFVVPEPGAVALSVLGMAGFVLRFRPSRRTA